MGPPEADLGKLHLEIRQVRCFGSSRSLHWRTTMADRKKMEKMNCNQNLKHHLRKMDCRSSSVKSIWFPGLVDWHKLARQVDCGCRSVRVGMAHNSRRASSSFYTNTGKCEAFTRIQISGAVVRHACAMRYQHDLRPSFEGQSCLAARYLSGFSVIHES